MKINRVFEEINSNSHNLSEYLLIFGFTFLTIIIRGYDFGIGNQVHYLTYLNYILNPGLYPNDYMIKTHSIPYTIFVEILGILARIPIDIQLTIFSVYALLLFIFYLAVYKTVKVIFPFQKLLPWLMLSLLIYPLPIGGSTITMVETSLIPRFVAEVFLMASLYFLLIKRFTISVILAAIGFLFHPLTLIPYPLILGTLFLYRHVKLKELLLNGLLFFILSLPILSKYLSNQPDQRFIIDPAWLDVLHERLPYIFVLQWKFWDLFLLACIPIFYLLYVKFIQKKDSLHPIFMAILISSFSLFVVDIIFELTFLRIGLQLQLGRNIYLMILFTLILVANLILTKLSKIKPQMLFIFIALISSLFILPKRIYGGILWNQPENDFINTALWARNNTSVDSVFLVPPDTSGFRYWSMRSVINENKEGGDSLYDRHFGLEWDHREDTLEDINLAYPSEVANLKHEFNFNYMVTTLDLPYKLIYQSGNWKIYQV